jgi:hypothetical protein
MIDEKKSQTCKHKYSKQIFLAPNHSHHEGAMKTIEVTAIKCEKCGDEPSTQDLMLELCLRVQKLEKDMQDLFNLINNP